MRKKYTRWYINNMDKVKHSFVLRIVHYFLFSPSIFYHEMGRQWEEKYNDVWNNSPLT